MQKIVYNSILFLVICFVLINCANRGNISGGEKDITPPVIVKSLPENFTTNFNENEIRIYFDEYIKIKNLQKQLIISPPMDPAPVITPLGSASKYITIKILDTLEANTTYAFNFGESIVDNNEENPYPYYRYVFSTGSYIDSLTVKGLLLDAYDRKPEHFASVLLYEVDSTFTDSIIYKQKPKYITNTNDSTNAFLLENLKAGTYAMMALKDENGNYTFQQKIDKIGFIDQVITIPTDSSYSVTLFKEEEDFKAFKPRHVSGQKIAFGYEGDYRAMQIELLTKTVSSDFEPVITKDALSDSLLYWYKPKQDLDSLMFTVTHKKNVDTMIVKIRDQEKDTLLIKPNVTRSILFTEDFKLESNIPLTKIDTSFIALMDKDSTTVNYTTQYNSLKNTYTFKYNKGEEQRYSMRLLPNAFLDFFGNTNDTLSYNITTKKHSDYGDVRLTLSNATYPVIVQLVDEKGETKYELYSTKPEPLDFRFLEAADYFVRVIFDANGNKKYDTGQYLKKIQPERVSYMKGIIEVRPNWFSQETFILD